MGTSAGPSLQGIGRGGASNLVLEMDAHDAKSYPGEPTSNLLDNPIVTWTDNAAVTATSNVSYGGQTFTRKCVNTATGASSPGLFPVGIQMTASASTVYTFSLRGFKDVTTGGGNVYLYVQNYTGSWGDMVWPGAAFPNEDEYFADPSNEIVSSTFTTPVSTTLIRVGILFAGMSTTGGIFYVKDLQVEEKGYATPFVREGNGGTGTYNARPASINLMIHGDVGTGTSFEDSSPSKHTITTSGNTTHSDAQSKFSGGSIYFDGTGDYLTIPASGDWDVGTGDWTLDCWAYTTLGTSYSYLFDTRDGSNTSNFSIYRYGLTLVYYAQVTSKITTGNVLTLNTWHHIALVRSGSTVTLYVDGTSAGSATDASDYQGLAPFLIGSRYSLDTLWQGYQDEFRFTKGTALWGSAFTPPTRRNLSAPVVDRSGNYNGINLINGTDSGATTYRVGEVIRPIDTAVWDFDGTDDYAIAGDSDDWNFGTEPFAIEQWLRFTDFSPAGDAWSTGLQQYASEGDRNGWMVFYSNTMEWRLECTAASFYPGNIVTGCALNNWYLFTISREGSIFKQYINGVLRQTDTSNPTFDNIAGPMYVGNYAAGDPHEFQGQMGALRIYKGGALTDQQVVENFNQQRNRFKV
jgi:hypothetical protein